MSENKASSVADYCSWRSTGKGRQKKKAVLLLPGEEKSHADYRDKVYIPACTMCVRQRVSNSLLCVCQEPHTGRRKPVCAGAARASLAGIHSSPPQAARAEHSLSSHNLLPQKKSKTIKNNISPSLKKGDINLVIKSANKGAWSGSQPFKILTDFQAKKDKKKKKKKESQLKSSVPG